MKVYPRMKAIVSIEFKPGVLDPEASAIAKSLQGLGFDGVKAVRRVRQLELDLDADNTDAVTAEVRRMCEQLLANPVIETYTIEIAG